TVGPRADGVRGGEADAKLVEVVDVEHVFSSAPSAALGLAAGVVFVASSFGTGEVDAQLLGRAEDVLVELAHLDLLAGGGEHLDVETERLHLLDEHLEALGDA